MYRDGLVYSTMSNLRGQTTHGPECFYRSSDESDSETDSSTTDSSTSPSASSPPERRDMRDEVPLKLNRPYLRQTASDILLRLRLLAKNEEGSEDYERLVNLAQLLTWLSNMESESPKLEMPEYAKIWMTIRDGMQAANDMTLQILSFQEEQRLREIKWTANCMWGVGCLNAAVRRLDPEQRFEEGSEYVRTFEGDLRSLSGQIHGLLLDSKDFWPEGKKWFGSEEEERILEAVWRVYCESQRRDY